MFRTRNQKLTDEVISELLEEMKSLNGDDEAYSTMAKNLEILRRSQSFEARSTVSGDAILMVSANIVGILLILYFEKENVITSKAFSFVNKLKP